jgi:hypothetical protein
MTKGKPLVVQRQYNDQTKAVSRTETIQWPKESSKNKSLHYLRLSFGHCIVSVLLMAFVWSLYCLCSTYGFPLVIVLSLYYLRLSFGHCIVSVLLTAFLWSLYCLCITYASVWSLHCLCTTNGFCLVIVLSLYYLRLSFGHCIVSVIMTKGKP